MRDIKRRGRLLRGACGHGKTMYSDHPGSLKSPGNSHTKRGTDIAMKSVVSYGSLPPSLAAPAA